MEKMFNVKSSCCDTELFESCTKGDLTSVIIHIERCMHDDKSRTKTTLTGVIEAAVLNGHEDIVEYLCKRIPGCQTALGRSLFAAVFHGLVPIIDFLAKYESNHCRRFVGSALIDVCTRGDITMYNYLVRKFVIDDEFYEDGFVAACRSNQVKLVEIMMNDEYVIDDKFVKIGYLTSLQMGHTEVLEFLDDKGDILWNDEEECQR